MTLIALVVMTAAALFFLLCYVCFRISVLRGNSADRTHGDIENGSPLQPFKKRLIAAGEQLDNTEFEEVEITSFDGLRLFARLYKTSKPQESNKIIFLFHGHHSSAQNDFSLSVPFYLSLGYNVLTPDMRAHQKSEGRYITFGAAEKRDCLSWVDFAVERFGKDVKIVLGGVSLGASSVLMAAGLSPGDNVRAVISESCFTSGFDLVSLNIKNSVPLLSSAVFATVNCLCRVFASFDLRDENTQVSLKSCNIPVLFIHGTRDSIIPCEMTLRSYAACNSQKELLKITGADHGICRLCNEPLYNHTVAAFLQKYV